MVTPGDDRALELVHRLQALTLQRFGDRVGQPGTDGPRLRRERERTEVIELGLVDEAEQLVEVLIGLAREADHDRRAKRQVGNPRA